MMTGLKGQDKRMSINIFRNLMVLAKGSGSCRRELEIGDTFPNCAQTLLHY